MLEFELPLGAQRVRFELPAAEPFRPFGTSLANLATTQAAVGAWLPKTLAAVREKLAERLPLKPGKKTTPLKYRSVTLLLPDDLRRVGLDPWLSELADGIAAARGGRAPLSDDGADEDHDDAGAVEALRAAAAQAAQMPATEPVANAPDTELPVQGLVLGQLDDPPLGRRLIRHVGEDFCGRYALESHRADAEDDHDPEQEGLDLTALRRKTLFVAVRPVFPFPHSTNDLTSFLALGLLARPLAEILEQAARAATQAVRPALFGAQFAARLQAELAQACAPAVAALQPNVVEAPFAVDPRGEPLAAEVNRPASKVGGGGAKEKTFDTVITAAGAAPTDQWFANLLVAAAEGCAHLAPGGRLIVLGACDEGLPFPALREVLTALQKTPRDGAAALTAARAAAVDAEGEPPPPALQELLRLLGEVLTHADSLVLVSPGLVPEEDDDDSERERRELPPGARIVAVPTVEAALALSAGGGGRDSAKVGGAIGVAEV